MRSIIEVITSVSFTIKVIKGLLDNTIAIPTDETS